MVFRDGTFQLPFILVFPLSRIAFEIYYIREIGRSNDFRKKQSVLHLQTNVIEKPCDVVNYELEYRRYHTVAESE
jgi:hypothetical protein